MSKEENENMMGRMMEKMMDEFFASMTPKEKKELMKQMMPKMMEKMIEGLTAEDRQELMGSMMPAMMSQMFGGEGGMFSMMMQMMSTERDEENPRIPVMETQEGFKPWEFCPCRILCEKAFKEKASS